MTEWLCLLHRDMSEADLLTQQTGSRSLGLESEVGQHQKGLQLVSYLCHSDTTHLKAHVVKFQIQTITLFTYIIGFPKYNKKLPHGNV